MWRKIFIIAAGFAFWCASFFVLAAIYEFATGFKELSPTDRIILLGASSIISGYVTAEISRKARTAYLLAIPLGLIGLYGYFASSYNSVVYVAIGPLGACLGVWLRTRTSLPAVK